MSCNKGKLLGIRRKVLLWECLNNEVYQRDCSLVESLSLEISKRELVKIMSRLNSFEINLVLSRKLEKITFRSIM